MATYVGHGVLLASAVVNSDCGRKGELLGSAADLADLLVRSGWPPESVTEDDARAVREMRPALRGVFTAASADEAVARVNRLLLDAGCVPQLARDGDGILHYELFRPDGPLPRRIEAHAAGELAEALRMKGFSRMRVCADNTCTDVFVDSSRNRSRRFCRPETCGNRNSVAAYRARRRGRVGGR